LRSIHSRKRREIAREFGASIVIDPTAVDVVADIKRLTEGRRADVAIEALGRQDTFEAALRSLRPGWTLRDRPAGGFSASTGEIAQVAPW